MEKLELSNIANRNGKWYINVGNSFSLSYQINFYIYLMTWEFHTQYFPKGMKNRTTKRFVQEYSEKLYS